MEARTPEKVHPLWVQAHNMGDLDGMMALCEPGVCFVSWSGRSVAGAGAVREAYRAILETKPHMELGPTMEVICCGVDLGLVLFRWTSTASLPDGTSKTFRGLATDIVCQQPDGRRLLVLDNSYGVRQIP
jgi:ketosteroid isomerase-like protein